MFAGLIEFEQYQPRSSAVKSLSLLQFCPCSTAGHCRSCSRHLVVIFVCFGEEADQDMACIMWAGAGSSHMVQVYCFTFVWIYTAVSCQARDKNIRLNKKLQVASTLQIHDTSLLITSLSQSRSLWQSASCILLMINNQIITEYYLSKRSIGTLIVTDSFCLIG